MSQHLPTCTCTHTRGSEEGLRQPAVGGNLFDLCGNIDEPSNHWRDSVKAQQSEKEEDTERDEERKRVQRKYILKRNTMCQQEHRKCFLFLIFICVQH